MSDISGIVTQVPPHIHRMTDVVDLQNAVIFHPLSFFFTTPSPNPSEVLAIFSICQNMTLAENFGGSTVYVGTPPANAFILTVNQNGSSIGTIKIQTDGTVVWSTLNGNPVTLAPFDVVTIVAPVGTDSSIAYIAVTLKAAIQ